MAKHFVDEKASPLHAETGSKCVSLLGKRSLDKQIRKRRQKKCSIATCILILVLACVVFLWSAASSLQDQLYPPSPPSQGGVDLVERRDIRVGVFNGTGENGMAGIVSGELSNLGYATDFGNADNFGYKETMVFYRGDSEKEAANEIAFQLGAKAVIKSADFSNEYSKYLDIAVILGDDQGY